MSMKNNDGCTIRHEKLKQNEFIASWKGPSLEITYEKHRQSYFDWVSKIKDKFHLSGNELLY